MSAPRPLEKRVRSLITTDTGAFVTGRGTGTESQTCTPWLAGVKDLTSAGASAHSTQPGPNLFWLE